MRKGDVVTIQCEHPKGATTYTKGRVGVITRIESFENEPNCITVHDEKGNRFAFWEEELKYADVKEISEALIRMIERR